MKITKFANLAKQSNMCRVITAGDKQYLTEGHAIYYAEHIPRLSTRGEVEAILELSEKNKKKIVIDLIEAESDSEILRCDMSDGAKRYATEPVEMVASTAGRDFRAILDEEKELLFFDSKFLSVLSDVIEHEGRGPYVMFEVRKDRKGQKYIAVKEGLITLAAIMPVKLLSDKYIDKLCEFTSMCQAQLNVEKEREKQKTLNQEHEEEEE
jgi:hypothetical protein